MQPESPIVKNWVTGLIETTNEEASVDPKNFEKNKCIEVDVKAMVDTL